MYIFFIYAYMDISKIGTVARFAPVLERIPRQLARIRPKIARFGAFIAQVDKLPVQTVNGL